MNTVIYLGYWGLLQAKVHYWVIGKYITWIIEECELTHSMEYSECSRGTGKSGLGRTIVPDLDRSCLRLHAFFVVSNHRRIWAIRLTIFVGGHEQQTLGNVADIQQKDVVDNGPKTVDRSGG